MMVFFINQHCWTHNSLYKKHGKFAVNSRINLMTFGTMCHRHIKFKGKKVYIATGLWLPMKSWDEYKLSQQLDSWLTCSLHGQWLGLIYDRTKWTWRRWLWLASKKICTLIEEEKLVPAAYMYTQLFAWHV